MRLPHQNTARLAILAIAIGITVCAARVRAHPALKIGPNDITQYATHIGDLQADVAVTTYNSDALERIGVDFKNIYSMRHLRFDYKQPDKLRLEGHSPVLGTALLVLNGSTRFYNVPRLHLRKVEDLVDSPAKRLSLLEYSGLLAADTLQFMRAHYVGVAPLDGQDMAVYDMTYQTSGQHSHYRLWIDPRTHITLRRDWFDLDNKLRATFRYSAPSEVTSGNWVPTQVEVRDSDGTVAATTQFSELKVNQGLSDTLFETR